jgi:hypothetical protein
MEYIMKYFALIIALLGLSLHACEEVRVSKVGGLAFHMEQEKYNLLVKSGEVERIKKQGDVIVLPDDILKTVCGSFIAGPRDKVKAYIQQLKQQEARNADINCDLTLNTH